MNDNILLEIFRSACQIRTFENKLIEVYNKELFNGPIYLCLGQEFIPATLGVILNGYQVFPQHRGHGYFLAFGGSPRELMNQILNGKEGSASIAIPNKKFYGHSGLLGDQVPIAAGMTLGNKQSTLCVMGDAAAEEDYVLATLGFASSHKLPILFICEDNNLSILTKKSVRRDWDLVDVAAGFGLDAININDDPIVIYSTIDKMILPALVNIYTCRHRWHAGTGIDGIPEQNRYELVRSSLVMKGYENNIRTWEKHYLDEMNTIWGEFCLQ